MHVKCIDLYLIKSLLTKAPILIKAQTSLKCFRFHLCSCNADISPQGGRLTQQGEVGRKEGSFHSLFLSFFLHDNEFECDDSLTGFRFDFC